MPDIPGHCAACGSKVIVPLPVEPLFNREEVCALVPMKASLLFALSARYKHLLSEPLYMGPTRKSKRMFSASDVRVLRQLRSRSRQ